MAAVTMRSEIGNRNGNLERMESFVVRAAGEGARAICFPELNISGYILREEMNFCAEPIPGPSCAAVVRMARSHEMLILAGLVEKGAGGKYFISHLAAGPEGLLGVYRKIHLGSAEEEIYQPGVRSPVFRHGRISFGIELCFDGHFPELTTMLAIKGAEVIFIPHASPRESLEEKQERWMRYLAARAYDNSVFVVACNQAGKTESGLDFPGAALILSPRGKVLGAAQDGGEGMILADLKRDALLKVRESPRSFFLSKRRPEVYRELMD